MKTILSVTGTRADYGIYSPVYRAIEKSKRLKLGLAVTGMHLSRRFGHTVDVIRRDGFPIVAEVPTLPGADSREAMAQSVGETTAAFVEVFSKHRPDVLLLLGDRGEMLAGATAAVYLGIPVAHLHGGEETGSVDDPVRHAITMLSTMHLTTAPEHAKNVSRMIGSTKNVYVVGAPALDVIRTLRPAPKKKLCEEFFDNPSAPLVLFLQHPDTVDEKEPEEQIAPSIQALEKLPTDVNLLILGSNADAGGRHFNEKLSDFAAKRPNTYFVISLPHERYLSWLAAADMLAGNSSSGIIEAASFHLPVVNIGGRQKGRLRSGNVIDVPYETHAIGRGIVKAQSSAFRKTVSWVKNAYGQGRAAEKVVKILEGMS